MYKGMREGDKKNQTQSDTKGRPENERKIDRDKGKEA